MKSIIKTGLAKHGILLVLISLIILFSVFSDSFLQKNNIINITRQIAMIGISAIGMTFVILTAGIDLSVGSVIALSGVVTSISMVKLGWHPAPAVLSGLFAAIIIGLINGIAVTKFKIPPLITTLGTMTSVRGIAFILTAGLPVYGFPRSFGFIGKGYLLGIPFPVILMVVFFLIGGIVLNRTSYGRYLYAIGGNKEAARLSGINVERTLLSTYLLSSLLTGIAGIVLLSRISTGQPNAGIGFEMDVITAVVLGGISIAGGEGLFIGVVYGVLIIGVLSNGLILMNVYEYYQQFIKGMVLLLAVGIDQYYKNRK